MHSPLNGIQPPYRLPSNIVYFHDWRYVDPGLLFWRDEMGHTQPLVPAPDPLPKMHACWDLVPRGVRIEAMPANLDDEPVLTAAQLQEPRLGGMAVLYEEGRYRYYYPSLPQDIFDSGAQQFKVGEPGTYATVRVAESEDGLKWTRPRLNIVESHDGRVNNLVFDTGQLSIHGGHIFRDESALPEARYKTIFMGYVSAQAFEKYCARRPGDMDPFAVLPEEQRTPHFVARGFFGGTSPDGYRWNINQEPMLIQHGDTHNICTYNELLGKYVAYVRTWLYGKRSVACMFSDDFRSFSLPEILLWPHGGMQAHETWYTPGYSRVPGARDYHLLMPGRWSQQNDTFSCFAFSSPDGVTWSQIPGGPMTPLGPRGSWYEDGLIMHDLVPLPGNRLGCLVDGWHIPHKFPRAIPSGQAGWAWWPQGRIVALRADFDGFFQLHPLHFEGREIVLNYRTQRGGMIQIEVDGVEGRSFAECDDINGDEQSRVVSWRGQSDIGHSHGQPVKLRFRLFNADLFSVSFR